jgi:hypothetical protein
MTQLTAATAALILVLATGSAQAGQVKISGQYTPAQIKTACDKVGGNYSSGEEYYTCENPAKSTSVVCQRSTSSCTGWVPRKATDLGKGVRDQNGLQRMLLGPN